MINDEWNLSVGEGLAPPDALRDAEDVGPYGFVRHLMILLVGAIRNVFEENLRLAKQSPFRTVGDACPYKICGIFDILSVGEDIILPLL